MNATCSSPSVPAQTTPMAEAKSSSRTDTFLYQAAIVLAILILFVNF